MLCLYQGLRINHNSIHVWPGLQVIALENHIPSVLLVLYAAVWVFFFVFLP